MTCKPLADPGLPLTVFGSPLSEPAGSVANRGNCDEPLTIRTNRVDPRSERGTMFSITQTTTGALSLRAPHLRF